MVMREHQKHVDLLEAHAQLERVFGSDVRTSISSKALKVVSAPGGIGSGSGDGAACGSSEGSAHHRSAWGETLAAAAVTAPATSVTFMHGDGADRGGISRAEFDALRSDNAALDRRMGSIESKLDDVHSLLREFTRKNATAMAVSNASEAM